MLPVFASVCTASMRPIEFAVSLLLYFEEAVRPTAFSLVVRFVVIAAPSDFDRIATSEPVPVPVNVDQHFAPATNDSAM